MNKVKEIETKYGVLKQRIIYLDKVEYNPYKKLVFKGGIVFPGKEKEIPYELSFNSVVYMEQIEYDTYFNVASNNHRVDDICSFFIVEESQLLSDLPVREDYNKLEYTHYVLSTYDDVFNIIAKSYEMIFEIDGTLAKQQYELFMDTFSQVGSFLYDMSDEDIEYLVFEELDSSATSFLHETTLDNLLLNKYISQEIYYKASILRSMILLNYLDDSLRTADSVRNNTKWREVILLADEIKKMINTFISNK